MSAVQRWVRCLAAVGLLAGGWSAVQAHELEPPHEIRAGCRSASDGCRVCKIDAAGGIVGCSFPGTACSVEAWHCNEPAQGSGSVDVQGGKNEPLEQPKE